jgi:uncharacterized phage protein (TIGR02220 family)
MLDNDKDAKRRFIPLYLTFVHHRKTRRLIKELGTGAIWNLLSLWSYAYQQKEDGVLGSNVQSIADDAWWEGDASEFVEALKSAGFLDYNVSTKEYTLHDWLDNNPFLAGAAKRAETARKAAMARWDKEKESNANSMQVACTEHAGRMQVECYSMPTNQLINQSTNQSIKKKSKSSKKANSTIPYQLIMDDLKEVTGRKFKLTAKNRSDIKKRWQDGWRLDDFKTAHRNMYKAWHNVIAKDGQNMSQYLRPSTLWSSKFENYVHWETKATDNRPQHDDINEIIRAAERGKNESK